MKKPSDANNFSQGLFSLGFGILLAGSGLFFILLFGQGTTFKCDRITPGSNCYIIKSILLFSTNNRTISIKNLHSATLEPGRCEPSKVLRPRSGGTECELTYRVVLMTSEGLIPLTNNSPHEEKEGRKIIDRINKFIIHSSQKYLTIKISAQIGPYATGLLFVGIGSFFIYGGWWQLKSYDYSS